VRVLRNFLRPGWITLAVVVIAFAVACFWVLAPWQLGKNSRTEHQNDLIKRAESSQPVPIADLYEDGRPIKDAEWSRISVTGTYLPDKQAVVRLRSIEGAPAYEVLTPFAAESGGTYLVNRGYVNPVQGTALPPIASPPSEQVTLIARIRAAEGTSPGREPRTEAGALQVYSIDPEVLSGAVDVPLAAGYLQLTDKQPGGLGVIDLPQLDSGPYLSYGLQWLAFGVMAPLGLGYFAWSEIKQRRAAKAGVATPKKPRERGRRTREALAASSTGAEAHPEARGAIGSGPAGTPDGKLSDRYGR
jgi:cytochrome oxidase assembly protein ShyY1